jgi:hypothetical protein
MHMKCFWIINYTRRDVKEEMCLGFIEYKKAFGHVDWTEILKNIGVYDREY